jgi:hypothetical protein
MPLCAFADESGHSSDPECRHLGIGIVVADSESLPGFRAEWQGVLQAFDLIHFHMREFAHTLGPFRSWMEDRRRSLMSALLSTVIALRPSLFGAVMSLDAWRALGQEDQSLFIDPWFPCLQECAFLAAAYGHTVGQSTVEFVFSQQPEFQGRAQALWELLRSRPAPMTALGPCQFADMRQEPGLQAADLLTYEMVLGHGQVANGATKLRYPFEQLRKCDHYFRYMDEIALRTQVAGARGEWLIPIHPDNDSGAD